MKKLRSTLRPRSPSTVALICLQVLDLGRTLLVRHTSLPPSLLPQRVHPPREAVSPSSPYFRHRTSVVYTTTPARTRSRRHTRDAPRGGSTTTPAATLADAVPAGAIAGQPTPPTTRAPISGASRDRSSAETGGHATVTAAAAVVVAVAAVAVVTLPTGIPTAAAAVDADATPHAPSVTPPPLVEDPVTKTAWAAPSPQSPLLPPTLPSPAAERTAVDKGDNGGSDLDAVGRCRLPGVAGGDGSGCCCCGDGVRRERSGGCRNTRGDDDGGSAGRSAASLPAPVPPPAAPAGSSVRGRLAVAVCGSDGDDRDDRNGSSAGRGRRRGPHPLTPSLLPSPPLPPSPLPPAAATTAVARPRGGSICFRGRRPGGVTAPRAVAESRGEMKMVSSQGGMGEARGDGGGEGGGVRRSTDQTTRVATRKCGVGDQRAGTSTTLHAGGSAGSWQSP